MNQFALLDMWDAVTQKQTTDMLEMKKEKTHILLHLSYKKIKF